MSFLGLEDFEDVFGGLRAGHAGTRVENVGSGDDNAASAVENVGGGLEHLTLKNICKRTRGAEAMHAVDSYPYPLAPGAGRGGGGRETGIAVFAGRGVEGGKFGGVAGVGGGG